MEFINDAELQVFLQFSIRCVSSLVEEPSSAWHSVQLQIFNNSSIH